jgi:hypothetical protein
VSIVANAAAKSHGQLRVTLSDCEYPLLAVAQDRSALLSVGDYCLSFD